MPLAADTKLGPYGINSTLGAVGMGEVYLAQDTRLGRRVALPDKFSRDSQRMARFDREAKVLASLNHPNIASIYGLEESNSVRALVMELVDGPTLAERVKQGPLALDESFRIAKQIAEDLEYAHERGTRARAHFADVRGLDRQNCGRELPPIPPRPQGVERNVVITEWDWADPKAYRHDEITTDK